MYASPLPYVPPLSDAWNVPCNAVQFIYSAYVADRAKISASAGKPIIIEETGTSQNYLPRDNYLRGIFNAANAHNYAGTLVWAIWARPISEGDSSDYNFVYGDPGSTAFAEQVQYMASRK